MDKLIPVINKLQDVFNTIGSDPLDLPQIVVVGSQSSGKSSVLEHIVGRDFLPRGAGIVTRRPLILQLIHLPPEVNKGSVDVEWGEFLHKPNEMFYDFHKLREEIERETERLTGKNKGVSPIPINLKIYSPHVLNLTLVDLPGMTRVPVGDQPQDIEQQIRKMIYSYIEKPNAIVLAITAANTDLSNSDALQLARDVDPEGNRTIGVLTKLDIMDKGTDALDMLLGRIIPLKLGFIGVVNRSQQDIIQKKPIREALKSEDEFFQTHPLYRNIASRCGTNYLTKTLNRILIQHIRDSLPDLKLKLNKMLAEAQSELGAYGDPLYDGKNSQGALLLQIITKFSSSYRDAIDGKLTELSINELYGGARINYIFNEIYSRCLDRINPTEGLTHNDIRTAIRNATGPKAALFVPEVSFELLVKGQISRLEDPSIQCVELVHEELQRIISTLETKVGELLRFSNLRDRIVEVVNNLLGNNKLPTKDMIMNLVNIELAFINTNHPDFVGGDGAITAILERMAKKDSSSQHQQQSSSQQFDANIKQSSSAPQLPSKSGSQQPQQHKYQQQPQHQQQQQQHSSTSQGINSSGTGQIPPSSPEGQSGFLNMFFGSSAGSRGSGTPKDLSKSDTNATTTTTTRPSSGSIGSRTSSTSLSTSSYDSRQQLTRMGDKLDQVPVTLKPIHSPTEKENFETELIKFLLISYFDIVRKNVKDSVPKTIMHFLVNKSKENIQNALVAHLYKEELFDDLLQESGAVAQRRANVKSLMDVLRKAHDILNEVRDYQV